VGSEEPEPGHREAGGGGVAKIKAVIKLNAFIPIMLYDYMEKIASLLSNVPNHIGCQVARKIVYEWLYGRRITHKWAA
jgi:hypothetical protein